MSKWICNQQRKLSNGVAERNTLQACQLKPAMLRECLSPFIYIHGRYRRLKLINSVLFTTIQCKFLTMYALVSRRFTGVEDVIFKKNPLQPTYQNWINNEQKLQARLTTNNYGTACPSVILEQLSAINNTCIAGKTYISVLS